MLLSKSFAYAIRAILYISLTRQENRKIQIDEIAERLSVPRHFLGKILQELARHDILKSTKGPYGGFELTNSTVSKTLLEIYKLTDDVDQMNLCVLRFYKCDRKHPCPLHDDLQKIREELIETLKHTTIQNLISGEKKLKLENIAGSN